MSEDASPATPVVKKQATFASDDEDADRERWPSRTAFYLAAIGSAVGFGNVWRFPALAKDYGGGAFFIPYWMAFFLIGLPILILEISMGQVHQTGNVGVFGHFHVRYRGVGIMSSLAAFMLVVYYSMLLSWVTRAFFDSFGDDDPWANDGVTGDEAIEYFLNRIIGMGTLTNDDKTPNRIVWANVGYSALNWFLVWLSLAFGLTSTGYLVYFTMGFPVVLLFVFMIRAVTLTGASAGIQEYIGQWDMAVLTDQPDVWSTAVSQIFFSLGTCLGTMPAYGSHCPRGEPAAINAAVIGVSNCMFSFISGFAVFASLGHLSYLQGVPVNDLAYAGLSLTFGTWPVVFGTFPGGEHWVRLLFFDLFLLGIDSAFSILESPITVFMDYNHKRDLGLSKSLVTTGFAALGFLFSIMYATDAGLMFLDVVDFYVNYILLLVGLVETFGAGWVFGIDDQIVKFGPGPVFAYMFANFGSVLAACIIWFGTTAENQVWGGFVALFLLYGAGVGAAFVLLGPKVAESGESAGTLMADLAFGNIEQLRMELVDCIGWLPFVWAFMMKQMIPQILLILFINLSASKNDEGDPLFGNYGNFVQWPFQALGYMCVISVALLFLSGVVMPDLWEGCDLGVDKREAAAIKAKELDQDSDNKDEGEDVENQEKTDDAAAEPEKTDEVVENEEYA